MHVAIAADTDALSHLPGRKQHATVSCSPPLYNTGTKAQAVFPHGGRMANPFCLLIFLKVIRRRCLDLDTDRAVDGKLLL